MTLFVDMLDVSFNLKGVYELCIFTFTAIIKLTLRRSIKLE